MDKLTTPDRIALVIDRPGWAYAHIAEQLIKNLGDQFEFKRMYAADTENLADILMLAEDCQLVHFFWRGVPSSYWDQFVQDRIRSLGFTEPEFRERFISGKPITTEIYDHLGFEGYDREMTRKLFSEEDSIVNEYAASSGRLFKLYSEHEGFLLRPTALLPDGVDLSRFHPLREDRFRYISMQKTVRFGWVGNSKWWSVDDLKGINTVIKPAIEKLRNEGYAVELVTSDRQDGLTPHYKMPAFYDGVDCYLCASMHEGTPNPVLEAMACGIPVITTDVGLVPELFGPLQMQYVLEERSADCMAGKIKRLLNDRSQFAELSRENLIRIRPCDWKLRALPFADFWRGAKKRLRSVAQEPVRETSRETVTV